MQPRRRRRSKVSSKKPLPTNRVLRDQYEDAIAEQEDRPSQSRSQVRSRARAQSRALHHTPEGRASIPPQQLKPRPGMRVAKTVSNIPSTPGEPHTITVTLVAQAPRKPQSASALLPLARPADDAGPDVWEAYRIERRRRKIIRANRRGRITRREFPHDDHSCACCVTARARVDVLLESNPDIDVGVVAKRAMISPSHAYRILAPTASSRRGLKTLATMRRIAHDGLGMTLDELALLVLPAKTISADADASDDDESDDGENAE